MQSAWFISPERTCCIWTLLLILPMLRACNCAFKLCLQIRKHLRIATKHKLKMKKYTVLLSGIIGMLHSAIHISTLWSHHQLKIPCKKKKILLSSFQKLKPLNIIMSCRHTVCIWITRIDVEYEQVQVLRDAAGTTLDTGAAATDRSKGSIRKRVNRLQSRAGRRVLWARSGRSFMPCNFLFQKAHPTTYYFISYLWFSVLAKLKARKDGANPGEHGKDLRTYLKVEIFFWIFFLTK